MRSIVFSFAFCALSLASASASAGLLATDLGLEPAVAHDSTSVSNVAALPVDQIAHPRAGDFPSVTSSEYHGTAGSSEFAASPLLESVASQNSPAASNLTPHASDDGSIVGNLQLHGLHLFTFGGGGDSGTSGTGNSGTGGPVVATPEPSSIVLLVLGAVGLVLARRRRK